MFLDYSFGGLLLAWIAVCGEQVVTGFFFIQLY